MNWAAAAIFALLGWILFSAVCSWYLEIRANARRERLRKLGPVSLSRGETPPKLELPEAKK